MAYYKSNTNYNGTFKSELKKANKFRVVGTEKSYLRHTMQFLVSLQQPMPSLGYCTPQTDVHHKNSPIRMTLGLENTSCRERLSERTAFRRSGRKSTRDMLTVYK